MDHRRVKDAAIEKIKERIRELAERRENVALAEIRWL